MSTLLQRRLELFPLSTQVHDSGGTPQIMIAGCDLAKLSAEHGTPLYVFDRLTLDESIRDYREALEKFYPGSSGLTYAGKAFLCAALAQWAHLHDLWLDCTGMGETAVALAGGAPRGNILIHGVNKSAADLQSAFEHAGTLVVDNLIELERIISARRGWQAPFPDLWLRLRPGLPVDTHAYTQTGQEDSKFGMDFHEAAEAVAACLKHGLPLSGLHFHQGSHFHDPAPLGFAIDQALDFSATMRARHGWMPDAICPGGGWGIAYHEDDLPHPPVTTYVRFIAERIKEGCAQRGLPLPHLQLEPGRSLVARGGVSIYRVGAIKQTPNRRWILLDGGMADNIRPALYGARYTALLVSDPGRPPVGPAWLGGPYCESGDILVEDLPMPEVQPGELISIPTSGAYHLSMSSNYNGALKPAVLWLDQGAAYLIQSRQTLQDLLDRDRLLPEMLLDMT